MKYCSKCDTTKKSIEFSKNFRNKDGLQFYCKLCLKNYYAQNKEKILAHGKEYKKQNILKIKKKKSNYYKKNKITIDLRNRLWIEEHRNERNAYLKRWAKSNPDKIKEKKRRYYKKYPDKFKMRNARRRAMKQNAPGNGISVLEWNEIMNSTIGLCSYCNKKTKLTMDHIEALNVGGSHDPSNVTPACLTCNISKHDKPLIVWLALKQQRMECLI